MKTVVAVEVAKEQVGKKWMSLQEVLAYTGLTKRTVEIIRREGKIKVSKISRRTYIFDIESLNNYINERTNK